MELSGKIKKKVLYVSLITCLILILSYQLSFKKTIALYKEYQVMLNESHQSFNLPEQILLLQSQLDNIAGTIESSKDGLVNKRNLIIDRVSKYCDAHSLIISELTPPIVKEESSFTIETNIIKTEGSFINLLKLINNLEQEKALGKVISVRFATSLNRKARKKVLFSEIYIQNITNQNK